MTSRRPAGAVAVVAGCLLVVLGGGALLRSHAPRELGTVPVTTTRGALVLHDRLDGVEAAAVPRPTTALPVLLRLNRLAVSARVAAVAVGPGGALGVPADPRVVGWWRSGAGPGSGRGSVVLDGHVDDRRVGAGALFTLRRSRPGDVVRLRDATGHWWGYVVTGLRQYSKRRLPAAQVFTQGGPERLVLVTCGGAFDRRTRQYADNVVVFAVPAKG